ncbi:choice-of-anchor P family protein [Saccharothrix deserti]|uniref:choice-of-anchor P family protein n=1 Tax=Saccharothrix deserti TaxID=2593674 RepID=UPI00131E034A|nr:choice-of-anchor P family protein [Saccharothrix deserti]
MRVRMTRRAAAVGLVAVAALVVGAAPASAAPGDASAHGARLDLSLLGGNAVSSGPFAAADANGPTSNTFAGVDLPSALKTGVINASASRDDKTGGVHSTASTADVRLDLLETVTGVVSADLVEARCAATQKGLTGKSELAGLELGRLGEVDAEPAPNTTVDVDLLGVDIAKLVFNEQIRNADGSLTVNALHLTLIGGALGSIGSGDLVLSSATCGPAGLPIPMASGAGLWIGLGLLALFGAPVAAAAIRRRRELAAV